MSSGIAFLVPVLSLSPPANSSTPSTCATSPSLSRRAFLHLPIIPLLLPNVSNSAPASSIANSILSAYGFPTIPDKPGFTALLEQYDTLVVQFLYPTSWIVQRNVPPAVDAAGLTQYRNTTRSPMTGRSSGLTAGNYRKAEGLAFFVDTPPNNWGPEWLADLVTPGDATGSSPVIRVVRTWKDGEDVWIETKYESVTVSGYSVQRRARTKAVTLSKGKEVYALCASATENRWKKVVDDMQTALDSFQVYRI